MRESRFTEDFCMSSPIKFRTMSMSLALQASRRSTSFSSSRPRRVE